MGVLLLPTTWGFVSPQPSVGLKLHGSKYLPRKDQNCAKKGKNCHLDDTCKEEEPPAWQQGPIGYDRWKHDPICNMVRAVPVADKSGKNKQTQAEANRIYRVSHIVDIFLSVVGVIMAKGLSILRYVVNLNAIVYDDDVCGTWDQYLKKRFRCQFIIFLWGMLYNGYKTDKYLYIKYRLVKTISDDWEAFKAWIRKIIDTILAPFKKFLAVAKKKLCMISGNACPPDTKKDGEDNVLTPPNDKQLAEKGDSVPQAMGLKTVVFLKNLFKRWPPASTRKRA